MPVVKPDISSFLPPGPNLASPEPRTVSQPPLEAGAKPESRKRSNAKIGSDRIRKPARPGPKVQIFKIDDNMKEVTKKPRVQNDEQKRRTNVVRKYGACPACRRARRQV